jgi:Flp pilus assembly protein TadD
MKESPRNHQTPPAARYGWVAPVVIAVLAAAVGVMGTLLWVRGHPAGDAGKPVAVAATDPTPATGTDIAHAPPPSLTAGMTPPQAAMALGNWYYDTKAWPQAVDEYRRAIALGVDNPDVRTDLGSAYRFAGEPDKALEEYRTAQRQAPNHTQSLFNLGSLYAFNLHQPDKAVTTWREYLKRFPNGAEADEVRRLLAEQAKPKP